MKISFPRHPGPVLSILVALMLIGLLAASIWYALEQSARYEQTRDELAEIEAQALRVGTLESRWRSISTEVETIERAFVRRDQLSVFLEAIEKLATEAGAFEQTSIVSEQEDEIRLRLRVSGPFGGIYTFVTHLNVLPNLLFLEQVQFFRGTVTVPPGATPEQVINHSSAEVVIRVPLQINS